MKRVGELQGSSYEAHFNTICKVLLRESLPEAVSQRVKIFTSRSGEIQEAGDIDRLIYFPVQAVGTGDVLLPTAWATTLFLGSSKNFALSSGYPWCVAVELSSGNFDSLLEKNEKSRSKMENKLRFASTVELVWRSQVAGQPLVEETRLPDYINEKYASLSSGKKFSKALFD